MAVTRFLIGTKNLVLEENDMDKVMSTEPLDEKSVQVVQGAINNIINGSKEESLVLLKKRLKIIAGSVKEIGEDECEVSGSMINIKKEVDFIDQALGNVSKSFSDCLKFING